MKRNKLSPETPMNKEREQYARLLGRVARTGKYSELDVDRLLAWGRTGEQQRRPKELHRSETRRARVKEDALRDVRVTWVTEIRGQLEQRGGPIGLPWTQAKAEEWVRSGDVHKHAKRTPSSVQQWEEIHEARRAIDAALDFMKEKGLRFRLWDDNIEWLPTPRGSVWVPVSTDSPQGHLAQAVQEMTQYAGYTMPDLVSYVLTAEEPNLSAVSLSVWRRPAPTGELPNTYATVRLNEVPTWRELLDLWLDIQAHWEKPESVGKRRARVLPQIMKPIIGEPGNWTKKHPWARDHWTDIATEYNRLELEDEDVPWQNLKRWASHKWGNESGNGVKR